MTSQVVLISGRSGSGKTAALNALEDIGFHSIDNLPANLLINLVEALEAQQVHKIAACIDARNSSQALAELEQVIEELEKRAVQVRLVFLQCNDATLVQRYSATRRQHPLTVKLGASLTQAIDQEANILADLQHRADKILDTSILSVHQLRTQVQTLISNTPAPCTTTLMSFGFKHGAPLNADYVFDVRCLPNPYWQPELRAFNGKDQAIIDFLADKSDVKDMIADIEAFCRKWLHKITASNRAYLTIAIGCTGGQHRSVYVSEQLKLRLAKEWQDIRLQHRELSND